GLTLGCWAGRRAGPLAAALDIFSLCQLDITIGAPTPQPDMMQVGAAASSGRQSTTRDVRRPISHRSGFRGSTLAEEALVVRIGLERTTAAPSRGLCGPPTVGAKDSLIGLLERGTHRRQRISALSTAALVRERLPYHIGSRPTQAFGEGPPVPHYVDRE